MNYFEFGDIIKLYKKGGAGNEEATCDSAFGVTFDRCGVRSDWSE
ncbi:hypothetical protein [Enterococcus sp.]|jgi:hypothetical protein